MDQSFRRRECRAVDTAICSETDGTGSCVTLSCDRVLWDWSEMYCYFITGSERTATPGTSGGQLHTCQTPIKSTFV